MRTSTTLLDETEISKHFERFLLIMYELYKKNEVEFINYSKPVKEEQFTQGDNIHITSRPEEITL